MGLSTLGKLKILHIIPSIDLSDGGPSRVVRLIEKSLIEQGAEVSTLTTENTCDKRFEGMDYVRRYEEGGVTRYHFRRETNFYKVSRSLIRWLKQEVSNYDIVHIHALFSYTSVMACRVARAANVPYVIRPLGVLNRYGMLRRRAWLKKLSLKFIERPLLRDAAAVHFTHENEKEEAECLNITYRSVVIPIGVDNMVSAGVSTQVPQWKSVICMSRIDPVKNLESLISAWGSISSKFPNWKLVLAGNGERDYVASLKELANTHQCSDSIVWLGHVEGEIKSQVLSNASIFILPSLSENFGIAAAEAMIAGKACIFTPRVAVGVRACQTGAAMMAETSASSLAKALTDLMLDEAKRRSLSQAAFEYSQSELSVKVMGRRLIAMYKNILQHN